MKKKDDVRARLVVERDRLAAELEELEAEASAQSQSASSGENNYRDHMADTASETFERERDLTLVENLRALLGQAEAAIRRLDDGVYGVCARCDERIPAERLAAHPTAEYCIECKKLEEQA